MLSRMLLAGAMLALAEGGHAETVCAAKGCPTPFDLTSTSEYRSYAVLIAAPDVGCRRVRFRIDSGDAGFLGHTPPLGPGELAVVRVGRGFAAGQHLLTIASEGCETPPAATRRVTLAKRSPDHGWRAGT